MALSGPERVFDIAIISKVPVTFARVMFAPEILATIQQLADDFKEEIAQLRIIARDAAITAELWLRSRHGTWRFFLVTPNSLVEIDRVGTGSAGIGTDACVNGCKRFSIFQIGIFFIRLFQKISSHWKFSGNR